MQKLMTRFFFGPNHLGETDALTRFVFNPGCLLIRTERDERDFVVGLFGWRLLVAR